MGVQPMFTRPLYLLLLQHRGSWLASQPAPVPTTETGLQLRPTRAVTSAAMAARPRIPEASLYFETVVEPSQHWMLPVLHWPSARAKATREATAKIRANILESKGGWLRDTKSLTRLFKGRQRNGKKVVFKALILYDPGESQPEIVWG